MARRGFRVEGAPVRTKLEFEWCEVSSGAISLDGQHPSIDAFRITRFPVLNQAFATFVEADGYRRDALWSEDTSMKAAARAARFCNADGEVGPLGWSGGRPPPGTDRHPVSGVSWLEARAFARFAEMQLPTRRQYVRAGRAETDAPYPWGCSEDRSRFPDAPGPADAFPQGASGFGVELLAGGVAEWSADTRILEAVDETEALLLGDHHGGTLETVGLEVGTFWPIESRRRGFGFRLVEPPRLRRPDRPIDGR